MTEQQLATNSGVDQKRLHRILCRRWTPSPEDRQRISNVFAVEQMQIRWGHEAEVANLYG